MSDDAFRDLVEGAIQEELALGGDAKSAANAVLNAIKEDGPADGRGILGEDFLGGADPVDAVREMRIGGYISTSSEQETAEVVQRLAEEGRNAAPVKFEADGNNMATLTFGPMHIDDLQDMLAYLGTEEGSANFQASLLGALEDATGKPRG